MAVKAVEIIVPTFSRKWCDENLEDVHPLFTYPDHGVIVARAMRIAHDGEAMLGPSPCLVLTHNGVENAIIPANHLVNRVLPGALS